MMVFFGTGCALLAEPEATPIAPGAAPAICGYGPSDPLGFIGETTLAEAGIPTDPELLDLPGTLYVTAGPTQVPMRPDSVLRGYCMVFTDGRHYHTQGFVPDGWRPPG